MLIDFFSPECDEIDADDIYFQQDGWINANGAGGNFADIFFKL